MKETELRKRATCSRCAKKIGESGILFATLLQRDYILNASAIRRQTGLGLMLGAGLAMHMGPDEDLTIEAPEVVDLTLCASCRAGFLEWLEDA